MSTVNIEGFEFAPTMKFSTASSFMGCFSAQIYGFTVSPDYTGKLNGQDRKIDLGTLPGSYRREISKEWKDVCSARGIEYSYALPMGNWSPAAVAKLTDIDEFTRAAIENSLGSWRTLLGNAGLVVFGDSLSQGHGWTGHAAKALAKYNIGVITGSHVGLNPNHITRNNFVQLFVWTPPWFAKLTSKTKPLRSPPVNRNIEELTHNIREVSKEMQRRSGAHWDTSTIPLQPHDPDMVQFEPEEPPVQPVNLPTPPSTAVRRVVRARKVELAGTN